MNKIKEILLGTSWLWLPLLGCYIANGITNLILGGM